MPRSWTYVPHRSPGRTPDRQHPARVFNPRANRNCTANPPLPGPPSCPHQARPRGASSMRPLDWGRSHRAADQAAATRRAPPAVAGRACFATAEDTEAATRRPEPRTRDIDPLAQVLRHNSIIKTPAKMAPKILVWLWASVNHKSGRHRHSGYDAHSSHSPGLGYD